MEPDVRFCTTDDGIRIAYCVAGDGPDMICCPDALGSFALDHLIEDQMGFWRALWHGRRVVRFDMRGIGLSDRDVEDVSHEALVRDLAAVVQASGAKDFTLWASTMSGPRAIAYAARHAADVRRLILHRTFARARDVISVEQLHNFAELARMNWRMAAQVFADLPVRRELPDAGVHQAEVYVQSTSGDFVARFLTRAFETSDVTALLPDLRVPTLVLHRGNDPMFPFRVAQDLAAKIPSARLRPLPQGIMSYLAAGRIDEVMSIINAFIDDGAATASAADARKIDPTVRMVLFTDLVGHTEMMRRLGDDLGRKLLREHERITRDVLRLHGGAEVKTMGDGFLASFGSVTKAMDCAIGLQRAFATHTESMPEPLRVRVGLNAGEPIEEEGDLFGTTVILASRICAHAEAGEILIPEPLRHLLSGKSYVYADRGDTMLKGFEDAVRLYEVRWQE
ncbi:MAG: adenylate/guanylate cyclase domain-containing protein [Dehalococcoidia bacterium]